MNKELIKSELKVISARLESSASKMFIFGSFVTTDAFNDIDLCIVAKTELQRDSWTSLKDFKKYIEEHNLFPVPVNVLLLTYCEYLDAEVEFLNRIKNRPTISLL